MDMKEVCRKFINILGDTVTDSFYDDDGGDYVELYIGGDIEIDIDSEYFGFCFRDHSETYPYDKNAEKNVLSVCKKINGILSGELCGIVIFPEKSFLPLSFTAESSLADGGYIGKLLAENAVSGSGTAEIFFRKGRDTKRFTFRDGAVIG